MTALEALSIVHGEQGFLILSSMNVYQEQEIIQEPAAVWDSDKSGNFQRREIIHPVQVLGVASREEFERQNARLVELIGAPDEGERSYNRHFYKVIALD